MPTWADSPGATGPLKRVRIPGSETSTLEMINGAVPLLRMVKVWRSLRPGSIGPKSCPSSTTSACGAPVSTTSARFEPEVAASACLALDATRDWPEPAACPTRMATMVEATARRNRCVNMRRSGVSDTYYRHQGRRRPRPRGVRRAKLVCLHYCPQGADLLRVSGDRRILMHAPSHTFPTTSELTFRQRANGSHHELALKLFMVIVLAHWGEHLLQATQIYVLGWPVPEARGILGYFYPWLIQSETLHYGYALVMLAGLWLLLPGFRGVADRRWWTIALGIQFFHHFEHALLFAQA